MAHISPELWALAAEAERDLQTVFQNIRETSSRNTERVLEAFASNRVSESSFNPTTGYGYNDAGRDRLDRIWAEVFGAESALVRMQLVNGTQALTVGLFGLLRPGDIMLSVSGKPYDTLEEVIGIAGTPGDGSLRDFGVEYRQVELSADGSFDYPAVKQAVLDAGKRLKMVFVQRSKGYLDRRTLHVSEIGEMAAFVKSLNPNVFFTVDNCYGEFVEDREPTAVGADLCIGSLIKNPGGGMAETGGYLAGTAEAIRLVSYRLTSVGTGAEVGATLGQNRNMYKGLFYAPHTVSQALMTAHLAAYVFGKMGFAVEPEWNVPRADIIQAIRMGSPEGMISFCKGLQSGSPVDAFVSPVPCPTPGYADEVIMAAGTFVSGSSIELSADGPLREPYLIYMQGGLTYESGKIGILSAAQAVLDDGLARLR
ncbi:MAG: methionine gamma-lyase family protein [Clostridia bacterium]|nr:methionine gamma-lyase family protein [Clostridia bacterium]